MATYLIESYATRAPEGLDGRLGAAVRVREEIYIAAEQLWICVVEARSRDDLERAARDAGLTFDRLSEAE